MLGKSEGHARIILDWLNATGETRRITALGYDSGVDDSVVSGWPDNFQSPKDIDGSITASRVGDHGNEIEIDLASDPIELPGDGLASENIRYVEVYLGDGEMSYADPNFNTHKYFHTIARFNPELPLSMNSVLRIKKITLEYGSEEFHPGMYGPSNNANGPEYGTV
jgi:hypothetical protein